MRKNKKIIIVILLLLLALLVRELTDDRMSFKTDKGDITSFNYKQIINKLKSKLNVDKFDSVFILGNFDSQTNKYDRDGGFQIHIEEEESLRFSSNIAVANSKGNYDTYSILKIKNRITIYKIEKNEQIDNVEVKLNDVFLSINNTNWNIVFDKLNAVHHYNFTIYPNYKDLYQAGELKGRETYIVSDSTMGLFPADIKFNPDNRYLEMEVKYFNEQGAGKKSNIDLLLEVNLSD